MDALGINIGLLLIQLMAALIFLGLPLLTLVDLAKKKLTGTPLAIWALLICLVPLIGPFAYWIVKPTAESKV